jgi:hypothetical protein
MIAGFFACGMPPGVLEPQAGGSIAVPRSKDKKMGFQPFDVILRRGPMAGLGYVSKDER